jgi:PAS domain S-box-containing protein
MKVHRIQQAVERFFKVGKWKVTRWLLYAFFAIITVDMVLFFSQIGDRQRPTSILMLGVLIVLHIFLVILVIGTVQRSLESIAEGEEKFRRIFRASPVAISVTSLYDGRLIDANDAYWKLTGYDSATSIGRTTMDFGLWSTHSERSRFVEKLKQQGSLKNPAYEFKSASGETRVTVAFYEWVLWDKQPAILSMFYDVTEQRKVQIALQASEEKYRNFVEQSMEGIWLLGFDHPISLDLSAEEQTELIYKLGYVAECNDTVARMYGYTSSEEFRGVRVLDMQSGETINKISFEATLKLIKDGYRSANRETMERMRNGEMAYFLNNAVGIIENNHLVGLWGTQLDITSSKKADEAQRRSESRIRGLLNAIPDMIFELDRDGRILQFIPSGINQPLFPPEQFINRTIAEMLPDIAEQTAFAIQRALESGLVNAFEYELKQQGEIRTFEARISSSGTDTVLAIVRDMSLRKWAEAERDKLIEELEAKNAELERFAYTVSHDLKSPLITIRGFLGFLQEDSRAGNIPRLEADIQRITSATDKMQALLNDLLELSRVGRLINKPELVSFAQIVTEAVELVQGRISLGDVSVSITNDLPQVYVDHPRLVEVMQNLIDNAAKFMGTQPSPRIEIGQQGFMNEMPLFYVRDNGIGIPPEFMDNIFGLFNKLDARTEGTGVGLALVKRIIEFHHGRIWAESELGKGSTFYFTLPIAPKNDR